MTHEKRFETSIENFTPSKQLLLCVDSDGCVMDSMTPKHKLCFGPLMIKEWSLEEHEEKILKLWNNFNLYSKTRGVNRFRGLALVLKEVNSHYRPIVGIGNLLHWTESDELSEASLMKKIEANHEIDIFKKALAWSRAVNRASSELGEEFLSPFRGVENLLAKAHEFADVAVVSGADPEALREEWTRHRLDAHVDLMLAQNAGSKSKCLCELVKKGYKKSDVLMCGDSMGDLKAAEQNGVYFYPVLAGREEESWQEFAPALEAFSEGRYGEIEDGLKKKFLKNLDGGGKTVNLKAKPYCLSDEDVKWVEETIAQMSDGEKVGQLFFQLTASQDEEYLKELVNKYHLGGCRYNAMSGEAVKRQNEILQKHSKIPLFIACNTESGGNGAHTDGEYIGNGIKIGATDNDEYAYKLGKFANEEAAAAGCNMAFAPVCDIHGNWQNTEVVSRAFGNDAERVARMSVAYVEGAHSTEGFASVAKHFPGNGFDLRDAHISNCVNPLGEDEWNRSFGKVYRALFEAGVDAVMGGHIMMPEYMKDVYGVTDAEKLLPATLCPEIMTELLREKLGFNGMVVSDASHMVAMTNRMTRREMLPACINAGCDMFLFFNDPDEDYSTMLEAYKSGIIGRERMNEALTRILGLKAKMGLHRGILPHPAPDKTEIKATAESISRDSITLVKYKDSVLPLTPEKYKRIMIVYVKGAEGPMDAFIKMAMGEGEKPSPAKELCDRLNARGFEAFIYESPLEKMKKQASEGEKPSLNLYFAGKNSVADFVSCQDLVITLFDVTVGRPSFGMSKGGGEIPWYVFEIPVIAISVNSPTMLADVPQVRTYINAYDSKPHTLDALVDKLTEGADAFVGKDPIDSFCGMPDTRI